MLILKRTNGAKEDQGLAGALVRILWVPEEMRRRYHDRGSFIVVINVVVAVLCADLPQCSDQSYVPCAKAGALRRLCTRTNDGVVVQHSPLERLLVNCAFVRDNAPVFLARAGGVGEIVACSLKYGP